MRLRFSCVAQPPKRFTLKNKKLRKLCYFCHFFLFFRLFWKVQIDVSVSYFAFVLLSNPFQAIESKKKLLNTKINKFTQIVGQSVAITNQQTVKWTRKKIIWKKSDVAVRLREVICWSSKFIIYIKTTVKHIDVIGLWIYFDCLLINFFNFCGLFLMV